VEGLPWLHVECKRTEKLALYDAIDQARRDAAEMQIPIVAHRRSRHRWVAILDLRDFLRLARETTIE